MLEKHWTAAPRTFSVKTSVRLLLLSSDGSRNLLHKYILAFLVLLFLSSYLDLAHFAV